MRNKLTFISTGLAICVAITFVGCNQEDYFPFNTDLSIDSQMPMTRSAGEQSVITGNDAIVNNNKSYTKYPNGCGLTVMVDGWIKNQGSSYFSNPDLEKEGGTAEQYQDKMIKEMENDPSYGWTPQSPSMSISTLMKLNKRFPIGTKKNSEGKQEPKTLFSGYKTFSSSTETNSFLGIKDSCEKVNGVMLRNEDGNGHMAFVSSYSKGKLTFTGYSILEKNGGYGGGTLQANGSKQNGWTIVGVMLK